jgi:hypothetical protein
MEYTEQYDARLDDDWRLPGYRDDAWPRAIGVSRPEASPELRAIPFLTRNPLAPANVSPPRPVEAPRHAWSFDLWDLLSSHPAANDNKLILAGILNADRAGRVAMERMNPSFKLDLCGGIRVNGHEVAFDGEGRGSFELLAGPNLLVAANTGHWQSMPSWVMDFPGELFLEALGGEAGSSLSYLEVSTVEDPAFAAALAAPGTAALAPFLGRFLPVPPASRLTDIFALTWAARRRAGASTAVSPGGAVPAAAPEALLAGRDARFVLEGGALELDLDFGRETVGFPAFEIVAPAGTVVDLCCWEAEWDFAPIRTDNLNNTLRYIASGRGRERFESANRLGFRYARLTLRPPAGQARAELAIGGLRLVENVYPVPAAGEFRASDARLTRYWEMGALATRLCMDDSYVDCPAYEQSFWVGDMRTEALASYAAFGDARLALHCLRLAADSLALPGEDGERPGRFPLIACVVPSGNARVLVNWAFLWVLALDEYWWQTADLEGLRPLGPALSAVADFIIAKIDERGLFRHTDWNMLDWAPLDSPPGSWIANENAFAARSLDAAARLSRLLGDEGQATAREAAAAGLRAATDAAFWSEEAGAYIDSIHGDGTRSAVLSQQTQIALWLCDCVPAPRAERIFPALLEAPEGWVPVMSPWMMWFLFEALERKGEGARLPALMTRHWEVMRKAGATTTWEVFSNHFGGRWNPTRSWCHAWSAAPTWFLSRCQLGLRSLAPGWRKAELAPLPAGLHWARGRYPTPLGPVEIAWELDGGGRLDLRVLKPAGMELELRLPSGVEAGRIDIEERP